MHKTEGCSSPLFFQECLGILAARCASCNCMTYFSCAPLQSCRRLYPVSYTHLQCPQHKAVKPAACPVTGICLEIQVQNYSKHKEQNSHHRSSFNKAAFHGTSPVSYTHLDVYKRQISPCADTKNLYIFIAPDYIQCLGAYRSGRT